MSGFTFHCNIYTKFFFNGLLTVKISLTYAIAENNGQNHSYSNSSQGRALPGAIFRWLLELEGPSGQSVSGKRACGCGVNRPRCHGITRGSCAKERCRSCARFKKKMPAEKGHKRAMSNDGTKTDEMQFGQNITSNCIPLHEESGSILIFRIILTLEMVEKVNKNHLIKNNNFHLPFYNWPFTNRLLHLW